MDLFGPTSVKSINHASYCLVITDDCTRFCWVFFLASKDETSGIIQTFIRQIDNQLSHRVKIIRSDNGTEFKNRYMLEFCGNKGIKQEYSNARTPQQNGVAERMNRTLIEAARTMLAVLQHLCFEEKMRSRGFVCCLQRFKLLEAGVGEIALKAVLETVLNYNTTSTPSVNTGSQTVNTGRLDHDDSLMPELEIFHKPETGIFDEASYDEEGVITDFNSLPTEIEVSPTPTLRIHSIHPKSQILGDPKSAVQTRSKVQNKSGAHALLSHIQKQQRNNHKDQQHCLFACFLSQEEPKKIAEALQDDSWVQAMQEELLQFKLQQVWVLVDLPHGMKVYKVVKALYGLHQAPRAWYATLSTFLEKHGYKRGTIDKTLFIRRNKKDIMLVQVSASQENKGGIFGSQDMYVAEIPKNLICNSKDFSSQWVVKRIFKYLKGKPNLGLWYPRESPFDLEAFSDSDYGGSNLDRKSTTGGCQFLGQRLISWQCKKQTIVATSTNLKLIMVVLQIAGQVLWVSKSIAGYVLRQTQSSEVLRKPDESAGFAEIVDFLRGSNLRVSLQLEDAAGITMLPNGELFKGMGQIGYPTDGTFTFWKSFFTPQWRYLVHHLLHCISSKSGGWDQFGSNIAIALVCLSTGRVYNFSKLIFDGMVANLKSKTKFLIYPRFLQMILNIQTEDKHFYLAVSLTKKIFGNMKRGFRGAPRPLLPSMLLVATNPNAGQAHDAVAPSQPSSSTPPVPSKSSPPAVTIPIPILIPSPPNIPIPTPTPPPIPSPTKMPDTEPTPFEHIYEESSPVHHHISPPQEL
ncbi:putative ribonuclease H-like domain-containing protein [Tanacetum coccineum]